MPVRDFRRVSSQEIVRPVDILLTKVDADLEDRTDLKMEISKRRPGGGSGILTINCRGDFCKMKYAVLVYKGQLVIEVEGIAARSAHLKLSPATQPIRVDARKPCNERCLKLLNGSRLMISSTTKE